MEILSAEYMISSPTLAGCPKPDKPEFAFIGRSNVGKSSLINMLTNRKKLALTSNKPGKTRNLNYFDINESWYLVDLPGYGFAVTSQLQRELWQKHMQEYLAKRENLVNVFLLVDGNILPQKKDIEFANWLGQHQIPFSIVFTKTDKPRNNELQKNMKAFKQELGKYWKKLPPFFVTSVTEKKGREELLHYIEECIARA